MKDQTDRRQKVNKKEAKLYKKKEKTNWKMKSIDSDSLSQTLSICATVKQEIDESIGYDNTKPTEGDTPIIYINPCKYNKIETENLTVPRTTIVTEDEFFNVHGYIFESDLKVEGTKLQFQDSPQIDQQIEKEFHPNGSDNIEIVCPKKVSVKMTRLPMMPMNRMMSKIVCPKNLCLKVKRLSPEMMKKYSTESILDTRQFECDICSKKFHVKSTLKAHLTIHGNQKWYRCTVCPKGFRSKISLKSHQSVHLHRTMRGNFICNICSNSFLHRDALKQHLQETHMGEKTVSNVKNWICQYCKMKFFTSQELHAHRRTHTDVIFYQCKRCPTNFTNKNSLSAHEREHNRKINIERPFECYLCKQKFALIHFLRGHMRIHTKRLDCRICLEIFDQEVDLDMHMLTHSGKYRFECSKCSKGFEYRTSFLRHLRIHSGERPYSCEHCQKTFREKDYLVAHQRSHNVDKTKDKTVDRTKFTWRYKNEQKFRQSKTSSRKDTNKKRKRAGKVFKCKICLKILNNENELNIHFEGHTGKYLFECQECEKGFDYRPNLYRHMKAHLGLKPYQCDLCPNRYGTVNGLRIHKRCHSGEKVECDICLQQFSDKGYLKIHKRLHTGEMPFQCLQCKGKYRAKQQLMMHTCFKCEICSIYFPVKVMIRRHMLDHLKQGQTNFH